jgi:hypothetical protein
VGYEYKDSDGTFKLADQSTNEALYLADRVHLNYHGTSRLIKNLALDEICYVTQKAYQQSRMYTKHVGDEKRHQTDDGWTKVERKRDIRCYNCGEENHVKKNCRFNQKIRCFHCGSLGHKSNRCSE